MQESDACTRPLLHVSVWTSVARRGVDRVEWVTVSTRSLSDWNALQECFSCWKRVCCYCSQPDSYRPHKDRHAIQPRARSLSMTTKDDNTLNTLVFELLLKSLSWFSSQAPDTPRGPLLLLVTYSRLQQTLNGVVWENMFWFSGNLSVLSLGVRL